MGEQEAFERIVAALHDAMIDDTRWAVASALIDETCGLTGNDLIVSEGPKDDVRVVFVGAYCRGQRREDQERDYLENYHPIDERVPRFRRLPDSRLVHVEDLFTAEELKTSPTYNEMLRRTGGQDSMNVRLDGPDGSSITWGLRDPLFSDGWGSSRLAMVQELLPHIRQFVRVRQALARADARTASLSALLDNPRMGVVQLDRLGRIIAANDRARDILRHGDGLADHEGTLRPAASADRARFERLMGRALPTSAAPAVSGSMRLQRSPVLPPFVVHVKPVRVPEPDYGAPNVAALLLIVEPGRQRRPDPDLVATVLNLTPRETEVAVGLAEGKNVRDIAAAGGHTTAAIHWHLNQIYQKQSISRQVDLVRLVLSLTDLG